MTVSDGRIPALTPFLESVGSPGVFFAGNASQGAPGSATRRGREPRSVNGFRYIARVLARHLAERLDGRERARTPVGEVVPFLLRELTAAPELWVQKGYLCRVVSAEDGSYLDEGVVPLSSFLDAAGPDALAATVEVDEAGKIIPMLDVRRGGDVLEHQLEPHPLHEYEGERYRNELTAITG